MASRSTYWSCTKFADWIRGKPKLNVGTTEEWNDWRTDTKKDLPIRFWIAEELLDDIQNFVYWPSDKLSEIRYYINNRWVTKSHACTAHPRDIKPGDWCDVGNRFLPCLFNELVDFVEIEQAWHYCIWSGENQEKYNVPWWRKGWLRWRSWRCPEAGMAYLTWASSLTMNEEMGVDPSDENYGKPTQQALDAKEIIELYNWWTQTYRKRPEPMEASGWSEYCDKSRDANGGAFPISSSRESPELREMARIAHEKLYEIEAAYESEDTEMLKRLIDIRRSLWT